MRLCPRGCPTGSWYPTTMALGYARHQKRDVGDIFTSTGKDGTRPDVADCGASQPGKGMRSRIQVRRECAGRPGLAGSSSLRPETGPSERHKLFISLFLFTLIPIAIIVVAVTKKRRRKNTKTNRPRGLKWLSYTFQYVFVAAGWTATNIPYSRSAGDATSLRAMVVSRRFRVCAAAGLETRRRDWLALCRGYILG